MFRVRGGRTAVPGAGAGCRGRGERPGGRPVPARCAGPSVDATVSAGPDVPGAALGLPDIGVTTRRTAARPSSDSRSRAAAPAIPERHHRTAAPPRAARPGSARCAAASPLRGRRRRPSRRSAVGPAAPQRRTPEQSIRRRSTELSPQPSCSAARRTGLPALPNSRARGRIPAPVRCRRPSPYCPAGSGRPAGQLRRRRPGSRGRPKNSRPRRVAVTPDASGCPSYPNRPSRPLRPANARHGARAPWGTRGPRRAHGEVPGRTATSTSSPTEAEASSPWPSVVRAEVRARLLRRSPVGGPRRVQGGASRCWVAAHGSAVGGQGAPHGCGPRGRRRRTASARSPPERGGLAGLRSIPICRTCASRWCRPWPRWLPNQEGRPFLPFLRDHPGARGRPSRPFCRVHLAVRGHPFLPCRPAPRRSQEDRECLGVPASLVRHAAPGRPVPPCLLFRPAFPAHPCCPCRLSFPGGLARPSLPARPALRPCRGHPCIPVRPEVRDLPCRLFLLAARGRPGLFCPPFRPRLPCLPAFRGGRCLPSRPSLPFRPWPVP